MSEKIKLILIGPGDKPIPPVGWGAIESLIWDYYENLNKNPDINVIIMNDSNIHRAIYNCNKLKADVIHIMYDDHIIMVPHLKCKKILYTSHYACITQPGFEHKHKHYFNNVFKRVIKYNDSIEINSISPMISSMYRKYGFTGVINSIWNGAREDKFLYTENPENMNKSVYIAKVENRKCQHKYQSIPDVDFVGNYQDSPFDISNPNYLGEWNKPKLYESLTHYGNLVLLSAAEADPLVVKEALIAGLGVVISECCIANLDLSKDFITVIPNDKLNDIKYVHEKIMENRVYSVLHRNEIRNYALEMFSWKAVIDRYVSICLNQDEIKNAPNKTTNQPILKPLIQKELKRIALIGPGIMPIPPTSWGAVEILIWDYYNELKQQGYDVTILNTKDLYQIINEVNKGNFDFVHIHYDPFYKILPFLKCQCIAVTSHYPYIDKLEHHLMDGYDNFFLYMVSQQRYFSFVLADKDMATFIEYDANPALLKKIKNGINSSLFKFTEADYNNRTVYLGKITSRKNQYLYQNLETIDFIGNCEDMQFNTNRSNYLGEWTREKIYNELTMYSNLLLLSRGEADPLVVKEALIAGLGVVINKSSAENLDVSEPFITLIDDDKIYDLEYVSSKIEENKTIANSMRKEIRDYGISRFDISIEVGKYVEVIKSII
jgi:glycosyltransferase involved in cell wall biosynthesis